MTHGPPVISNDGATRLKLENNGNDGGSTGKTVGGLGTSYNFGTAAGPVSGLALGLTTT